MPRNKQFSDLMLSRLKPPATGQVQIFDSVQKGLAILIGARTKTFRSHYRLHGKWVSRSIGKFGEFLDDNQTKAARERVEEDRRLAANGIDPKMHTKPSERTFANVLAQFVERHCQPRQRTWKETGRLLKRNCEEWLTRPIDTITTQDAETLLDEFIAEGHTRKATLTLNWLRTMWTWGHKKKLVKDPSVMRNVELRAFQKRIRDRVYDNGELKAIWTAADKLDPIAGAYVKLLMLLAPRKTALAKARWSDFNDDLTVWTTPFELTKSKKTSKPRVYVTPLPPLASRILKSIPRRSEEWVFPSHVTGTPIYPGSTLTRRLVRNGAPKDFGFHQMRHTLASFFANASDFEVGLLLNHSHSNVTAGYRHSYALELKLKMLTEWSDHVEALLSDGENVTRFA